MLVAACSAGPSSAHEASRGRDPKSDSIRTAINGVWDDHLQAAERGDVVGVSAMYVHDAVYAVRGSAAVYGRPAIDVAFELGTIVGRVRPDGDTVRTVRFEFMAQWRVAADRTWRLAYIVGQ